VLDTAMNIVLLGLAFAIILATMVRSTIFRRLFMLQWLTMVAAFLAIPAVLTVLTGMPLVGQFSSDPAVAALGRLAFGALILVYLFKSVRVRNTLKPPRLASGTTLG
jgi:hypothetical protein